VDARRGGDARTLSFTGAQQQRLHARPAQKYTWPTTTWLSVTGAPPAQPVVQLAVML
jgi:hypothetical protein